jgi:tetratricopeptide (TPR) repeat protein
MIDEIQNILAAARVFPMQFSFTRIVLNRRVRRAAVCCSILHSLATAAYLHASCTAPESLRVRVQNQPSAESYASLGRWFGDQQQFRCAAEAFSSAVKLQPDSDSLNYMWGLSLYSAGDVQESFGPLHRAANLNPSDAKPHLVLATALDQESQIADAEREWRAALAIDPNSAMALDGLSRDLINDKEYAATIAILEQTAHREHRTHLQALNLGMAYARTLQLEESSRVLREGLNAAPDFLPLANELAVVLMLMDRPGEADSVLKAALVRHPGDVNTEVLYLRVLVSSKSEEASQLAQKLLVTAPHNWEVLYLNAQLEMRGGQFAQARTHLEESVALKPDYFQSQELLGSVLSDLDDFTDARGHLEKAIELGDNEPAVQYKLAKVFESLGQVDQSKEKLRIFQTMRKAEADRTLAVGKIESGDRALADGDTAQAVAMYREALADDPDEALVAYKLAMALDKMNDLAGETVELERAIELNPNLAEAQNQMGYLAAKKGDDAQAESCFRASVHASASYLPAWINLAATLAGEAKWLDAKQALAHALEIDPNSSEAQRIYKVIAAAEPKH